MTSRLHRRLLYAILAAYVVLASVYSIVTPIFEASDELWHYPMVKHLADNGLQLPIQDPTIPTLWRQEGGQPPLYYMLAALLTGGIETSDMEVVRRQNPHADIGVVHPDGNVNMIVHRSDMEAFPWHGTVLAVHLIRFFSVALGLGTVIVTYALARTIFPERLEVALGAAALNAFLPMFLFISGSVNNDNLSNLLGNLLTLLIVLLLKAQSLPSIRTYIFIGVVAGAGLLSKFNIGFLLPLVALALIVVSLRLRSWRPIILGGLISGGLSIAIAGWWYLRNIQLYGDPTGLNVFLSIVGRRSIPANAAQLWAERHSFTQAFWGFFGGVNVPLPDALYLIFNLIGNIGLLGAVAFLINALAKRKWTLERWLPALVTMLWSIITFISYLRWTMDTPASQGRLIFGALSSILMWLTLGLIWWLPQRIRPLILTGVVAFFAVVAIAVPFTVIAPAYAASQVALSANGEPPLTSFQETAFDGTVELIHAAVITETIQPESYAMLDLTWKVESSLKAAIGAFLCIW